MGFITDIFSGGSSDRSQAQQAEQQAQDNRQQAAGLFSGMEGKIPAPDTTPMPFLGDFVPTTLPSSPTYQPSTYQGTGYNAYVAPSPETKDYGMDARGRQAAIERQLNGIAATGYDQTDKAAIAGAGNDMLKSVTGANAVLRNQLAARGALDSGASTSIGLQNNQSGVNALEDYTTGVSKDALARRLAALSQASNIDQAMRSTDAQIGETQQALIEDFNKNAMSQTNAARQFGASATNSADAANAAASNVAAQWNGEQKARFDAVNNQLINAAKAGNLQQQYALMAANKDLVNSQNQQYFANLFAITQAHANALNGVANGLDQQASNAGSRAAAQDSGTNQLLGSAASLAALWFLS